MKGEVDAVPALRARRLLARPGAQLAPTPCGWVVRAGGEGRQRVLMRLTCPQFERLAAQGGLTPCRIIGGSLGGGVGYRLSPTAAERAPGSGTPDAQSGTVAAASAQAPRPQALDWLARRCDASGRPWLDLQQICAARRLEQDHARANLAPSITARLDGPPPASRRTSSGDHLLLPAVEARARVRNALAATGPQGSTVLGHICLEQRSLGQTALRMGLSTATTRVHLQQALTRLARHYRG